MIIYGWKSRRLLEEQLEGVKCNNCDETNTLFAIVDQRCFHVFWIPFIPIGKQSISHCTNCGKDTPPKKMPLDIREGYERARVNVRTPWYTFSGLALVLILISSIAIKAENKKARTGEWIKAPHSMDVIEYKTETGAFSIMKVSNVVDDSITLFLHNYEYDRSSGLEELKKMTAGWQIDTSYTIHKQVLVDMFEEGEILGIDRVNR